MKKRKISHVQVFGKAKYIQDIPVRGHPIRADEPDSVGHGDTEQGSYDFSLAGLGACAAITLHMLFEKKGWDLGEIEVSLTLLKDENHTDRIEHRVKFTA